MRAIQDYKITFTEDALEHFKNAKTMHDVLEYTGRQAATFYEGKVKVLSVVFLASDFMQVVIELPFVKNYEASDVFNEISKSCTSLPFCSTVLLTDDNPEQ